MANNQVKEDEKTRFDSGLNNFRPRKGTVVQNLLKSRQGLLTCLSLAAASMLMVGCESAPVYRGLSQQEASNLTAKLAGTEKPRTELGTFYQAEEKYTSWKGTWNCNNQLVKVAIKTFVFRLGEGNTFEGTRTVDADQRCETTGTSRIVGRYDDNFVYMYDVDNAVYVMKYEIEKKENSYPYPKGTLIYRGQWKYINDVVGFKKGWDNPEYGITGRKIPESGGPADMWETTGYVPKKEDPSLSAANRKLQIEREDGQHAAEIAGGIAQRQAERDATDRESDRAATAAALRKIASDYQENLAQRSAATPSFDIVAESKRAADAQRADVERRAAVANRDSQSTMREASTASTIPSARPSTNTSAASSSSRKASSLSSNASSSTSGGTRTPAKTYTCTTHQYFTSLIHGAFEEACTRAEKQANDFAAAVRNGQSYSYKNAKVTVQSCRKSNSGEQAVVYVDLTENYSTPCDAETKGVSR